MSIIDKPIVKTLMLKGEKGDPGDLDSSAIVDNLTTNRADKVLSAKQGKVLNDKIDDVNAIKPSMYDTVALMKADTDLIDGDYAQTLGYYSANDGGGATYKITAVESEIDYQEELDNELYATLIVDSEVNVKQFGAKGNNVDDDTTPIQTAINKSNVVFIPTGVYLVSQLNLKSKLTLYGEGKNNSVLKSVSADTLGMLCGEFDESGYEEIIIHDLYLNGNNIGNRGIYFNRENGSSHDTWCNIYNMKIGYFLKNGIYLGKYIREVYVDTIEIYKCSGNGLYMHTNATDIVVSNVVAHNNELNGFLIEGNGNRFDNCKAFWNGRNNNATQENRKSGYYVSGWSNKFIDCDAQENALNGFDIISTNTIILIGCSVDRNGLPMTDWSSDSPSVTYGKGINIYNCNRLSINALVRDFRKYSGGQTQKYGVYADTLEYSFINLICQHQENDYYTTSATNCDLTINGYKIQNGNFIRDNISPSNDYVKCISENSRFGYDIYSSNSIFQISSNKDDTFKIDSFKKENGSYAWKATPLLVNNEGDVKLGRYNTKIGFYNANPIVCQTITSDATDLTSVITLANDLKSKLINLGLIKN